MAPSRYSRPIHAHVIHTRCGENKIICSKISDISYIYEILAFTNSFWSYYRRIIGTLFCFKEKLQQARLARPPLRLLVCAYRKQMILTTHNHIWCYVRFHRVCRHKVVKLVQYRGVICMLVLLVSGLSVHGFIEALLAIAKKSCTASETLAESFQRLVSSCHATLEDERRRVASLPRLASRRRMAPTLSGRRSAADVSVSPRQPPSLTPGQWQTRRSASSGALCQSGGGSERANNTRRIDYKQFSPDVNGATPHRHALTPEKNDRVKAEH